MSLIKSLKINWLTDEEVKRLSFGEVKNEGTINPDTWEAEIGGLFCSRIFGPQQNYQCDCKDSKYQKVKNQKCENCGVLIAHSNVRRWRMGHIKLVSPVTNTLIFQSISTYLGQLLEIPSKSLTSLIYFESWLVIDSGHSSHLQVKQVLSREIESELINDILTEIIENSEGKSKPSVIKQAEEMRELLSGKEKSLLQAELKKIKKAIKEVAGKSEKKKLEKEREKIENELAESQLELTFLEDYLTFLEKHWKIKVITGSQALDWLLKKINLKEELKKVTILAKEQNSEPINNKLKFIQACLTNQIPLEGLILNYLPIIPAGLRPAAKLTDNTIATASINSLYRKVIITNKSIGEAQSLGTGVLFLDIIHNRQRRLQEVVDQLISGGTPGKTNPTKSLLQTLSGKEGVIRKYSLGKRVDYSARSVIIPSPQLKLNQVGLPVEMALILYKPFLIASLLKEDYSNEEIGKLLLVKNHPVLFSLLQKIIQNHPILLNRAPTLHRLGILGFQPILVRGKSIQIHPLITTPLNADFDGDQVAIHLPLTKKARLEVQDNVMANYHLQDPKNGRLIDLPTQDMILGIYYLTKEKANPQAKKEIPLYYQLKQIYQDCEQGKLTLSEPIIIPATFYPQKFASESSNKFLLTTFGKLQFNQILPPEFPYLNDLEYYNEKLISPHSQDILDFGQLASWKQNWEEKEAGWRKKDIITFLNKLTSSTEQSEMVIFLDKLKELAFTSATQSGITISLFDLPELAAKEEIVQKAQTKIQQVEDYYQQGFYGEQEFSQQKLIIWSECKSELEKTVIQELKARKDSSLYQIWDSGARANSENLTQIFGMRGNMTDYRGNIIETPIVSSLKEGLNAFEFFLSVYGAMKGMIDTALKTAEAGYLTRRLVEATQSLVITEEDCQTLAGIWLEDLREKNLIANEKIILIPLKERISGRYLAEDLEKEGRKIFLRNTLLEEKETAIIEKEGISAVKVRSPFTCSLKQGICQKCYGLDLSKNRKVIEIGSAVGIIAAQSLGEPGTQLTMNTFHTGGVSGQEEDITTQGLPKVKSLLDNSTPLEEKQAVLAQETGEIIEIEENELKTIIKQKTSDDREIIYSFKVGKSPKVKKGQIIQKGESLTRGLINLDQLLNLIGRDNCQKYIKEEVWKVYYSQGIKINEKHMELFTRQMLGKVKVIEAGDSNYLPGDIINYQEFTEVNHLMQKKQKELMKVENVLLGLKQIVKHSSSFLAAISFQDTLKSLVHYSLFQPTDYLQGVKENMIAGQLIPVGVGLQEKRKYESKIAKVRATRVN